MYHSFDIKVKKNQDKELKWPIDGVSGYRNYYTLLDNLNIDLEVLRTQQGGLHILDLAGGGYKIHPKDYDSIVGVRLEDVDDHIRSSLIGYVDFYRAEDLFALRGVRYLWSGSEKLSCLEKEGKLEQLTQALEAAQGASSKRQVLEFDLAKTIWSPLKRYMVHKPNLIFALPWGAAFTTEYGDEAEVGIVSLILLNKILNLLAVNGCAIVQNTMSCVHPDDIMRLVDCLNSSGQVYVWTPENERSIDYFAVQRLTSDKICLRPSLSLAIET